MDLDQALAQYDAIEANLERLDKIWDEMSGLIPEGLAFFSDGPEPRRYAELDMAFRNILSQLPSIDGWTIAAPLSDLNAIAQARFEAEELGEFQVKLSVEDGIAQPGHDINEYRFRMHRARRALVHRRVEAVVSQIDELTSRIAKRLPLDSRSVDDPDWPDLSQALSEVDRLAGNMISRDGRWSELRRHAYFGQGQDLYDIVEMDWPSVRRDIIKGFYSELDPLPVTIRDLSDVDVSRQPGPVATKLSWERLSDEEFERLLFNILSDASDYENPQWLMHTNAPDRGRDISADHRVISTLSGTRIERVIVRVRLPYRDMDERGLRAAGGGRGAA